MACWRAPLDVAGMRARVLGKCLRIAWLPASRQEDRSDQGAGAFCPANRPGPDFDRVTRVRPKVPDVAARMVLAMAAAR